MAVFSYTPDFSTSKRTEPKVSKIQFGDGYQQRVAQGINTRAESWIVTFKNRPIAEIEAIEDFFEARAGVESFDWTAPRALTAIKVVCSAWDRSYDNPQTDTITATFERIYEP